MSVGTRLKVLVSCMKRAVRTRFKGSPRRLRRRVAGVAEDKNAMAIRVLRIAPLGLELIVPVNWGRGATGKGAKKRNAPNRLGVLASDQTAVRRRGTGKESPVN